MPELDLGSVIGPQGPKGDKGIDGAVGPMGPQGEKGDDGAAASINGVNALTMTTGDGLEATMNGSAYHIKLTDNTLNAVRVVPTFTRPNLLDNWYFGRPVDQRGGKIIQSGVNIYTDSTLKTLIGPAAYACPVVELTSTYAKVQDAKNTGSYYYAAPADVVRGYTGNWNFTVDRWSLSGSSRVLTIRDGAIHLQGGALSDDYIFQRVPYIPAGEYCYSVLFRGNTGGISLTNKVVDLNMVPAAGTSASAGLLTLHYKLDSQLPDSENFSRIHFGGECDILAAKLELGPTQTLAHQDAAGKWVLNEVPKYSRDLLDCQRYYLITSAKHFFSGWAITGSTGFIFVPVPTQMRMKPIIIVLAGGTFIQNDKTASLTAANFELESADAVGIKIKLNGLNCSTGPFAVADAQIAFSADL